MKTRERYVFVAGHKIEEHAKVYLVLSADGTHWELDPIIDDGWPLDGLTDGPTPKSSDCECSDREECWKSHNYASYNVPLPNAKQLYKMLKAFYET